MNKAYSKKNQSAIDSGNTVFIGGLPGFVKRDQIHQYFKKFGTILNIKLQGN